MLDYRQLKNLAPYIYIYIPLLSLLNELTPGSRPCKHTKRESNEIVTFRFQRLSFSRSVSDCLSFARGNGVYRREINSGVGELIFLLPSPKTVRISPHNRAYRPHWPRYVSFLGDVAFLMCLPCLLLTLLSPSPAFRTHAQTHQLALLQWKWMLALTSRKINFFFFCFRV